MIDKVSEQNNMNMFDHMREKDAVESMENGNSDPFASLFDKQDKNSYSNHKPEMKSDLINKRNEEKTATRRQSWEEIQSDLKKEGISKYLRGENSVMKVSSDRIKNEGGSGNMIGCKNSNSIFDSDIVKKLSESMGNKERILAEKESIIDNRNKQQLSFNPIQEIDESNLLNSKSSISSISTEGVSKGWGITAGSMSMFDKDDFERLKDTDGENMKTRKVTKDDSWRKPKTNVSTKNIQSNMMDSLLGNNNSSNSNLHKNSVNRLYNILSNDKSE